MSKKELPNALKQQQEQKRQDTLKKVQEVIDDLKEMNLEVTKKRLIEETGYSASTFSKQHVKELLQRNRVCQFKEAKKAQQDIQKIKQKHNQEVLEKANCEINLLKEKLVTKDVKISELENNYKELNEKYQLLLGRLYTAQRRAEAKGIEI